MTLKEFYGAIDASYDDVMGRLMKEDRIKKYLLMFKDSKELENMDAALKEENYEVVFRCLHSLKGTALNLGITVLGSKSSDLCEKYRGGVKPSNDVTPLMEEVKAEFAKTAELIGQID